MKVLSPKFAKCLLGWGAAVLLAAPLLAQAQYSALNGPVPFDEFNAWPKAKKISYHKELMTIFSEFEIASQDDLNFAASRAVLPFWLSLMPEAIAEGEGKSCLIGGVQRKMVPASADKYICPTTGRPCGSHADGGYRCGAIYNDACVSRLDPATMKPDSISRRCIQAAGDTLPNESRYNEKRTAIQSVAVECSGGNIDSRYKKQCAHFIKRMNKLNASIAPPAQDASVTLPKAIPEQAPSAEPDDLDPTPPLKGANEPAAAAAPAATAIPEPRAKKTKREKVAKTNSGESDCIKKNSAKLGVLACVACGIKDAAGADYRNGDGVSNWVALLGVMAQSSGGPYNVGVGDSQHDFQQRVAEMVSSYGYCTNNEYPINPGNQTRDYIDRGRMSKADQAKFARDFQLMSTSKGFFFGNVENAGQPMTYAEKLFAPPAGDWNGGSPQTRQWRFRSYLKAHRQSYKNTAFATCANAAENRLKSMKAFKMCPIKQGQWPNGALKLEYPSAIGPKALANNENFYQAMASSCGITKPRRLRSNSCDHSCFKPGPYKNHALPRMPYCRSSDELPDHDGPDPENRETPEKEGHRTPGGGGETPEGERDRTPGGGGGGETAETNNDREAGGGADNGAKGESENGREAGGGVK